MKKLGFRRKTLLDEDFVQQQRITAMTKSVSEVTVKHLTPGGGGLLGWGKTKGGTEEEKKGDSLVEEGTKLRDASGGESLFGQALNTLGYAMRKVGEAHANTDMGIMENVITPLKNFLDTSVKQVYALEKRTDSASNNATNAKKALEKKNDGLSQDACRKADDDLEEAKTQYFNAMRQLQESENERVEQIKIWVDLQLKYHQSCLSTLQPLAEELQSLASQKPNVPPPRSRGSVIDTIAVHSSGEVHIHGGGPSISRPPPPPARAPAQRQCR